MRAKILGIGFCILIISFLIITVNAQVTNSVALSKGINYIQNSNPEIWDATSVASAKIFLLEARNTGLQFRQTIINRRSFDRQNYPFVWTILQDSNFAPPDRIELRDTTMTDFYRMYNCQPFTSTEITVLGNKTNTVNHPYDASHAIFILSYISRNYRIVCGQNLTAQQATLAMQNAELNGLTFTLPPLSKFFDAFLEQECARGIVTGTVRDNIVSFVTASQDANFGGWWHTGRRLNEPYRIDDANGESYLYYPELPNAHTTMFAMCILAKATGAT